MTPRLTPRRLEFLRLLAKEGRALLYTSYEDIPEYGLNKADVDALVTLGFITVGEPTWYRNTVREAVLTDAGRRAGTARGGRLW